LKYFLVSFEIEKISDTKKEIDKGAITEYLNQLCECVRASLFLSHNIRRDVNVLFYDIIGEYIISINGAELKYMGPDLRSISLLLLKAKLKTGELRYKKKIFSTPGIVLEKRSVVDFLKSKYDLEKDQILYYATDGTEKNITIGCDNYFMILQDLFNITKDLKEEFRDFKPYPFNFNNLKLNPTEFIIVFNNYLDRIQNE